jgi:hypothetical protein
LLSLLNTVEDSDAEPTTQVVAAVQAAQKEFSSLVARWNAIQTTELAALNTKLRAAGQQPIAIAP